MCVLSTHLKCFCPLYSNLSVQAQELVELMRSSSVGGTRAPPQCSRGLWEMALVGGIRSSDECFADEEESESLSQLSLPRGVWQGSASRR